MVGFEVGRSVLPLKRCLLPAEFASACCSGQDVLSHRRAPRTVDAPGFSRFPLSSVRGSVKGMLSQSVKRWRARCRTDGFIIAFRLDQVEHYDSPIVSVYVHASTELPGRAGEPAQVAIAFALAQCLEQVYILAL